MHESLRERIDAAAERHAKAKRQLLRSDGAVKFSIPEHQELEEVARREFEDDLRRVEDEVDGRLASAEQRLQVEENRDPSSVLSREELEEANLRRTFTADEASALSPDALEQRIRALISSGDRPAMFVYAHVLRGRLREAGAGASLGSPAAEAERRRLEGLAGALEAALDPEAAGRLEKAQAEIDELQKIRDYAYLRRNGAKDPVELHLNRAYGSTKW